MAPPRRLRDYAAEIAAMGVSVLIVAISIYALIDARPQVSSSLGIPLTNGILGNDFSQSYGYVIGLVFVVMGMMLGAVVISLSIAKIFDKDSRAEIQESFTDAVDELKRSRPVDIVDEPREIWNRSIQMLDTLSHNVAYRDRRAYDVTTYPNKLSYEEAVLRVLQSGAIFSRVFAIREADPRPSDKAQRVLFNGIVSGQIDRDALDDTVKAELVKCLHNWDQSGPTELTEELIQVIEKVMMSLHACYLNDTLRLVAVRHRLPIDFVAIGYQATGQDNETHEVMANFKTDPAADTYVIGIHSRGALAARFITLHENVIEPQLL